MKRQLIILFTAILAFSSCEKVIDFDPGDISPYVVMISRPECDSAVTVRLSLSSFFLEDYNSVNNIADATLKLHVGGSTYNGSYISDTYNGGYYRFNVVPQSGDSLYVEATIPGVDWTVSAGTRIPARPQVEIVDYTVEIDEYQNATYKLRFKIKSSGSREYYSIDFDYCYEMAEEGEAGRYWDTVGARFRGLNFSTDDALAGNADIGTVLDGDNGTFYGVELNVTNEMFKDNEHLFTIEFTGYYYDYTATEIADMPVWLNVRSLSPELYRYNQAINAQYNADDLFTEPVQVLCNIDGGIGIFGGMAQRNLRLPVAIIK